MCELKRGVDWGKDKKRKVKGAWKTKERKEKETELQETSRELVGEQKQWLIITGEPLDSRGRNLLRDRKKACVVTAPCKDVTIHSQSHPYPGNGGGGDDGGGGGITMLRWISD